MRFLLLAFLSVMVSCGQDTSSSGKGSANKENEDTILDVAPSRVTDLLDVAMDVPVEISGDKIIFKQSASASDVGNHSTCAVNVTSGEVYSYSLDGTSLIIKDSSGKKMILNRKSGENGSIVGVWSGRAMEGTMTVQRRMAFLSANRLVMRTHCES